MNSKLHFTQQGRVVYDRPKHVFNEKDVRRICLKVIETGNLLILQTIFAEVMLKGLLGKRLTFRESLTWIKDYISFLVSYADSWDYGIFSFRGSKGFFSQEFADPVRDLRRTTAALLRAAADSIEGSE